MSDNLEKNLARENLHLATNTQRIKAFVVDELLISLLIFFAFFDKLSSANSNIEMIEMLNHYLLWVIVIKVAYHTLFVYKYGATLGKLWQKIYIVEISDFSKPSFLASLTRANIRIFSEWLFYFGFLWAFVNPHRQTLQDKVGKTVVIYWG